MNDPENIAANTASVVHATSCKVRPANRGDWQALRMLLPEQVHFGARIAPFVAMDASTDEWLGAIVVDRPLHPADAAGGHKVALATVPMHSQEAKKMGAKAMLDAVVAWAKTNQVSQLCTWGAMPINGPVHAFWKHLGFDGGRVSTQSHSNIATAMAALKPLWQRLQERGRVPEGMQAVPLDQADHRQIAALHAACIGGSEQHTLARLAGTLGTPFTHACCPAIVLNGQVVAATLGHVTQPGIGNVEATFVDPAYRNGWANAAVKWHGLVMSANHGLHTLIQHTDERHPDTAHYLDKLDGVVSRTCIVPQRTLLD